MARKFNPVPGDRCRFRLGDADPFTVIACDGVLVSFAGEERIIHVPIGDVCYADMARRYEDKHSDDWAVTPTDAEAARYHGDIDGDGEL